jgi:hypothetical protein
MGLFVKAGALCLARVVAESAREAFTECGMGKLEKLAALLRFRSNENCF